jgi:hypothetical protein
VCVLKWFSKSNKSECPHCKSQFLWLHIYSFIQMN